MMNLQSSGLTMDSCAISEHGISMSEALRLNLNVSLVKVLEDVSYKLQLSSHRIITANIVHDWAFSIDIKSSLIVFFLPQKNDD